MVDAVECAVAVQAVMAGAMTASQKIGGCCSGLGSTLVISSSKATISR